jgi:hypothetical protein
MGGKGSPPPAPNYVAAAEAQADASKELTNIQNFANRPTINTPFGSQSWQTASQRDPATGQTVTSWTQNNTLAPGLEQALNAQVGTQLGRSSLANDFMGRVRNEYGQQFDWQNIPQMAQMNAPSQLQTGMADYSPGLSTDVSSRANQLQTGIQSNRDVSTMLPADWSNYDANQKINWFNSNNVTPGELRNAGVDTGDIQWMTQNGYNSPAFNFGGPRMSVDPTTSSIQRSLQTADNPALPQFDASYRDNVARSLMERMQPVHERQQQQLETQLANQGFNVGSEGYTRALADLQQRQSGERFNALDMAGQEAQRLFNMGMGARQQAFQEDVTGGQFGNQAVGQQFQQNMGAAQFGNQAQQQLYGQLMGQADLGNRTAGQQFQQDLASQQFRNQALGQAGALDLQRLNAQNQALSQQQGLNQQFAAFQNQLRQQAIAEQMQRRGMSLNEMNALLSGQQVNMPQMPSFVAAQRSETPNILGATQMGYDAALGAYNAQQAQSANTMGGLFSLGSSALQAAPFMFSDKRLKRNIKRVGTHPIGVGIYDYTMLGYAQRGVIAQEVQSVRPDLVKRHANGYLMVNYGGL